jgi:hypothetical protein
MINFNLLCTALLKVERSNDPRVSQAAWLPDCQGTLSWTVPFTSTTPAERCFTRRQRTAKDNAHVASEDISPIASVQAANMQDHEERSERNLPMTVVLCPAATPATQYTAATRRPLASTTTTAKRGKDCQQNRREKHRLVQVVSFTSDRKHDRGADAYAPRCSGRGLGRQRTCQASGFGNHCSCS